MCGLTPRIAILPCVATHVSLLTRVVLPTRRYSCVYGVATHVNMILAGSSAFTVDRARTQVYL